MKKETTCFFDESGIDGASRYFAVGLLKIGDPTALHTQLENIRNKHHFYEEIKSTKISRLRYKVEVEWIDIFFKSKEIKMCVMVVDKDKFKLHYFGGKDWIRFNKCTKDFLNNNCDGDEPLKILADEKPTQREDNLKEYLETHVFNLAAFNFVDSKGYDGIQLCDLLLGLVRSDFEGIRRSRLRTRLVEKIRGDLRIEDLKRRVSRPNFNIWIYTPKKV